MSIIKKLEDSIWAKVILAVIVVVIAFAARSVLENKHEESQIDKQTAGKTIEGNRTIVVTDKGDSTNYDFSDPIAAPVENQKIQFKNIDKEGEIEIIITGEKKGAVGYAIYRMIDGQPVDLFGEGMEDCC